MEKDSIELLRKNTTKRKFKALMKKQRVVVPFNTGTRIHDDAKLYRRHAKHRKRYDKCD